MNEWNAAPIVNGLYVPVVSSQGHMIPVATPDGATALVLILRSLEQLRSQYETMLMALESVPVLNSLREHRNNLFQISGVYDGAMSDDCKEICRRQFNALDALIDELKGRLNAD